MKPKDAATAFARGDGSGVNGDMEKILIRLGLRRTIPRLTILEVLAEAGTHLSVLPLHRRVADTFPMVNLSMVYRNVTVMSEHGVLHSVEHGGETLFGLAETPHHHLLCEKCGLLAEVPADRLDPALASVLSGVGFEMDSAGQLLRGRCRRCRHASRDAR
ncbi:transcriptional repressor [Nonomuraea sp. MG754425]|uniref:Fur family transcriptional regulator n=1 Tax=Nonomuraea sp. MG754425 TaxID=2570319 RepID=UPI001F44899F|nr:Fur family transcriptional regulator [Nonomuraea sp. MG754425]MCF6476354.1 transcriptional repressor [Nonomuraea sp. MG754425]